LMICSGSMRNPLLVLDLDTSLSGLASQSSPFETIASMSAPLRFFLEGEGYPESMVQNSPMVPGSNAIATSVLLALEPKDSPLRLLFMQKPYNPRGYAEVSQKDWVLETYENEQINTPYIPRRTTVQTCEELRQLSKRSFSE